MLSSYQLEERAFSDFNSKPMDMVVSFGRRSTGNNIESSNIHIKNQIKLNEQCISNTIAKGVKIVNKVYDEPQSGFFSYSKSYAKRIARTIKRMPKGARAVVVVSSLGRISREYKTISRLKKDLEDYDVYLQFSSNKYEKSKIYGLDYKVVKLADVQEKDLAFYRQEVMARVNPLQEERVKTAVRLLNLGVSAREVYKKCNIWQGAVKAYQAKHPLEGRILRGNGRLAKSKKVIDLYNMYGMTVEAIARKVGYSVRNVYYIMKKYKEAMKRIYELKAVSTLKESQKALSDSEKVDNTGCKIGSIEYGISGIGGVKRHRDVDV